MQIPAISRRNGTRSVSITTARRSFRCAAGTLASNATPAIRAISTRDKLSTTCVSCHKKDDPHRGQLGPNCETCHNERGWRQKVAFDHDLTRFPLIGHHGLVPCEESHRTRRSRIPRPDAPIATRTPIMRAVSVPTAACAIIPMAGSYGASTTTSKPAIRSQVHISD